MPDEPKDPWSVLLWDAWSALGVSGWNHAPVETIIDPEALIVATAAEGDERLFQETIDWGITNARVLMPSRIRRLAARLEDRSRIRAERWIATVAANTRQVRWAADEAPLDGFEPSGRSGHATANAAGTALRLRALGGATARTELLRALIPIASGSEGPIARTELVERAGVARGLVHEILDDLDAAALIVRSGSERLQRIEPALHDAFARAWWGALTSATPAPWNRLPGLIGPVRRAARSTDGDAIADHVERVQAWRGALPILAEVDRSLSAPLPTGSSAELAALVVERSRHATESIVHLLRTGRQHR